MVEKSAYYIVNERALPKVLIKTVMAKQLLDTGKVPTIGEAVVKCGISRGTFYKYKELISPFYDMQKEKIITLLFILEDIQGVLSTILHILAKSGSNILTINQNIPINSVANITIAINTTSMTKDIKSVINKLQGIEGVKKISVLSGERNEN